MQFFSNLAHLCPQPTTLEFVPRRKLLPQEEAHTENPSTSHYNSPSRISRLTRGRIAPVGLQYLGPASVLCSDMRRTWYQLHFEHCKYNDSLITTYLWNLIGNIIVHMWLILRMPDAMHQFDFKNKEKKLSSMIK